MLFCFTSIIKMYSNKMRPRVTRNSLRSISSYDNGASKTLVGIMDKHAYISHNLGITWKQINDVSGTNLTILYCGNDLIILSDYDTGRVYFLNGKGKLTKEFVFKPGDVTASVHPNDSNAILLHNFKYDEKYSSAGIQTTYYTKDGGASEWKVLKEDGSMGSELFTEVPFYEFITGGTRDLVYVYEDGYPGYTQYTLNFFSKSSVEFTELPFVVQRAQNIFYAIENDKELHVSTDGVNFEQVKLSHSSPWEHKRKINGAIEACGDDFCQLVGCNGCDWARNDSRAEGSLFLQKRYDIRKKRRGEKLPTLPWVTLFRYDVERKEIKTMLESCYDYMVVSAEKGIIIANYVTNPHECINDKGKPEIRTVITFNDGTDWEPMIGPSGAEFNIVIPTSLRSGFGDIPSNSSKMIVCGKEGPIEYDREFPDINSSLSTYMTKDSGRSWRKINDNAMNWMIGGDEDIIVMSQAGQEHILYSLDGGVKWQKLTVGFPVYLKGPSNRISGKRFMLGGCTISFDPADQQEQSYL